MIQPPITEFISNLKDEGYVLHVENGRLKVIHPSRPLDDTARQFIREYKPDIVHALTREAPGPDTTPADTPQSPDLVFKKTPPPPSKPAKPAKPGGKTDNFSNFSRPIPGFSENSAPSPALPSPAEDTPPAPVEPTAPDDDWHSAVPKDTMRRYIEKEQSTWTDERRQAQADEIQRIEEYRRQRGPRPSGPPAKLDRSEVFAADLESMS